ncbi:MAG: DDE domain-containing protein [Candidatus Abyssobacteria bacterium SURF_17]|uniref:DDE domain-containing protein n=1 Tax=Candidatus Abyssobacteria bacterium SURF_17 TaxID=2093361 RepID=A0A419F0E2_9BACT|nr:MAG: DDE domain-containing protein [Candidatus Abyssubacteria bacterium SURF_17]
MRQLSTDQRAQILKCLVDGNSIRATVRITGAAKNTVTKLLVDVGMACAEYQNEVLRNLPCKRIQCDEIWSFVYAKEKNVPEPMKGHFGFGDVWTFTAICADTKLVPSWLLGRRDLETATVFMNDLARRLKNKVQLTTDGHKMYLDAVDNAFGSEIDFSQLIKLYGSSPDSEVRYSPAECTGIEVKRIQGKPDPKHISTSYVERQNLTIRMSMRRFTRLTNGFSKKVENLSYAVALHFMYYNFCRLHQTLRVTPAMEAGIADHVWEVKEILALLDSK